MRVFGLFNQFLSVDERACLRAVVDDGRNAMTPRVMAGGRALRPLPHKTPKAKAASLDRGTASSKDGAHAHV